MPDCGNAEIPLPAKRAAHRRGRWPGWLAAGLLAPLLAACSPSQPGGDFEIRAVDTAWQGNRLQARVSQRLELSSTARDALEHGVPLTIELNLVLRRENDRTRVLEATRRFELRYLPLSEHYRVSADGVADRNYPRLRHALAHLASLDFSMEPGPLPSGEYEVLVRSRLDRGRLPPPMRLPALLRSGWVHESGWTSWALTAESGA